MTDTLTLPMPTDADDRVLLHGMRWNDYESVLDQIGERHIFVTYDGRNLEIMSPSPEHDNASGLLSVVVRILAEELHVPLRGLGSTTFRQEDLEKGLEPDKCFYTKNEAKIRGKKRLDLRRDPPPDLAIEVEITQRLLDREQIYAALGVPELWRYDGRKLRVFVLVRGKYRDRDRSRTFPGVPLELIERWLRHSLTMDEATWALEVRAYV